MSAAKLSWVRWFLRWWRERPISEVRLWSKVVVVVAVEENVILDDGWMVVVCVYRFFWNEMIHYDV